MATFILNWGECSFNPSPHQKENNYDIAQLSMCRICESTIVWRLMQDQQLHPICGSGEQNSLQLKPVQLKTKNRIHEILWVPISPQKEGQSQSIQWRIQTQAAVSQLPTSPGNFWIITQQQQESSSSPRVQMGGKGEDLLNNSTSACRLKQVAKL